MRFKRRKGVVGERSKKQKSFQIILKNNIHTHNIGHEAESETKRDKSSN